MSLTTPLAESSAAEYHTALNVEVVDSATNKAVPESFTISRQTLIRIIAGSIVGIALIVAITVAAVLASTNTASSTGSPNSVEGTYSVADPDDDCPLAHIVTEGPYWVDEKLNRSDITAGEDGVPLDLFLTVYNASIAKTCIVSTGAMVDIWHTNADAGKYSDIQSEGTKGQTWLRGYQLTDGAGVAHFHTLYPSWYRGRTTHIHIRVRLFTGTRLTYDSTTQLFFDDDISTQVFATYPYNKRSGRDTFNRNDGMYRSDLQLTLKGDIKSGYSSNFAIGIPMIR